MAQRITWVDNGRFWCMMWVMVAHLESYHAAWDLFCVPFVLETFCFLSGYVYREPSSFKNHISKKACGLLIPWFIFSNLNILLSAVISLKDSPNLLSEMMWNFLQIRSLGDGMWFIAALFVAYIPFYFFIRWNQPVKAILLSFALSFLSSIYVSNMPPELLPWNNAALPWHLEYMFTEVFWMTLGYYYRVYAENKLEKFHTKGSAAAVTLLYLVCIVSFSFIPAFFPLCVAYVQSILGVCMVILWSKLLPSTRFSRFVGINTLVYFALHGKVYTALELILGRFSFYTMALDNIVSSSLLAAALTILIAIILIIPTWIINNYFPWMLGRRRKRPIQQTGK